MDITDTLATIESDMKQGRFQEAYNALTGLLQTRADVAKVHAAISTCCRQF